MGAIHLESLAQQVPTTGLLMTLVYQHSCTSRETLACGAISNTKAGWLTHAWITSSPQIQVRKKNLLLLFICFWEERDDNLKSCGMGPCRVSLPVKTSTCLLHLRLGESRFLQLCLSTPLCLPTQSTCWQLSSSSLGWGVSTEPRSDLTRRIKKYFPLGYMYIKKLFWELKVFIIINPSSSMCKSSVSRFMTHQGLHGLETQSLVSWKSFRLDLRRIEVMSSSSIPMSAQKLQKQFFPKHRHSPRDVTRM